MKKKTIAVMTFILASIMAISACSAAKMESVDVDDSMMRSQLSNAENKSADAFIAPEIIYDESSGEMYQENPAAAPDELGVTKSNNSKIIYTASIAILVKDADSAMDNIAQSAIAAGGYVSGSSFNNYDDERYAVITVRIPPERLNEFTDLVGSLGEVENSNLQSQDVTEEYIDIESRLKNARAQEIQLLAIMEDAIRIEDILLVRNELNYVQQEIEQYEGRLRYLDSAVDYSTVTVTISEKPVPLDPKVDPDEDVIKRYSFKYVRDRIEKAFKNSFAATVNFLASILIGLSTIVIPLAIFLTPIIILIVILRLRSKKRRKAKKLAAAKTASTTNTAPNAVAPANTAASPAASDDTSSPVE
ncbi:MAG: DUF4349 domain-containing protein [Clostridiaceae bacterium]|nr:DUF4349 domain-containing protein [Clostridiaceae bacterium]